MPEVFHVDRASRFSPALARRLGELGADVGAGFQVVPRPTVDELVLTNPTTRNAVRFHPGAEASFDATMRLLHEAKKSFSVETFIWHDDVSGRLLAKAMVAKVKAARAAGGDFEARVLIDSNGLHSDFGTRDRNILDYFASQVDERGKPYVQAFPFNPRQVKVWDGRIGIPLTHRKIYLADGHRYLVGGRNVGDEYDRATYEKVWGDPSTRTTSYRDLLMEVEGEEAGRVAWQYEKNWTTAGGTPHYGPHPAIPAAGGRTKLQTFVTDPLQRVDEIRQAHLRAIAAARHEIVAVYPYFGDKDLVQALAQAKRSNTAHRQELFAMAKNKWERQAIDRVLPELSVKVILPIDGENGHDLNYQMGLAAARKLVKAGVEVRLSRGGTDDGVPVDRYSHFKALMIDRQVMSVGSANGEHRTMHDNHEIVNVVADPTEVGQFHRQVLGPDWEHAVPLTDAFLKQNQRPVDRLRQFLAPVFEPFY